MTHVLVVSDIRLYREGLAEALERDGRLDVVATAADMERVERRLNELAPDALLQDMSMSSAFDIVRSVRDRFRNVSVVALGVLERPEEILPCAEAGVAAYVSRDSSLDELVGTVEDALRGRLRCSGRIARALLDHVAGAGGHARENRTPYLTPRELEVAGLLNEGLTNQEIAGRLAIEVATVKCHVHNILDKVGVHHRGEAAARLRGYGVLAATSFRTG